MRSGSWFARGVEESVSSKGDGLPIELRVELTFVDDSVGGAVTRTGASPEPFQGWLGLLAVLEELRPRAGPDQPGPRPAPPEAPTVT